MPEISVIIPVKDGAKTLERCLQSIVDQTIADRLEIIILDSFSIDKSTEIAARFNAKVIAIPEGAFNHGLSRNIGVNHALGSLLYFTVQDARIAETNMLERMVKHFEDNEIVAVVGHQAVPHEQDKDPFLWYKPCSEPEITIRQIKDIAVFKMLPTIEQKSLVAWDNVVSMYRKGALQDQPFVKTGFAEDWVWSYDALLKGLKLLRDSSLIVYHYHHETFKYNFSVAFTTNYHFYKFFKFRPVVPSLIFPIIQFIYHLLKKSSLSFQEKMYWISNKCKGRLGTWLSTINFILRYKFGGERSIEQGYNKYCKEVPQGAQKKI